MKIKYTITEKNGNTISLFAAERSFISCFNRYMITIQEPADNFNAIKVIAAFNINEIKSITRHE